MTSGQHARVRPPRRRRRTVVAIIVGVAVVVAALLLLRACRQAQPAVIRAVVAGDMACDPADPRFGDGAGEGDWCRQREVSDLAVSLRPDVVLGVGDYQYELPSTQAYDTVYGPGWGRLRDKTIPAIGNQEYKVFEANTFYSYFGDRIGAGPKDGYWSQDVGPWHVVVLNSNCTTVEGGCLEGSPQQRWLAADLAANTSACTVALWHHPRFSNGIMGPDQRTIDLFRTLKEHRVDMVLSGHEADYERFGPLDEKGRADPEGVRQVVVGTGGQIHYEPTLGDAPWRQKLTPAASEFVDFDDHGVLLLELRDGSYSWEYHTLDGEVLDAGSADCLGQGGS